MAYLRYENNFEDSASHQHHAAVGGGDPAIHDKGKFGHYVEINGVGEYVSFGDRSDLNFGDDQDFTLLTWYRASSKQLGDPVIIGNKDWSAGENPGALLLANEGDGDDLGINIASGANDRKDLDPIDHSFHDWWMLIASFDRDGASVLYAGSPDGRLHIIADDISGVGDISSGLSWNIGQDGTGAYRHKLIADLDDTAIWRRALTKEEVKSLFDEGRGVELWRAMGGQADANEGVPPHLDASVNYTVGEEIPVIISANINGEKCSLQTGILPLVTLRNAKFDCVQNGHVMTMTVVDVAAIDDGGKQVSVQLSDRDGRGGLVVSEHLQQDNERNAAFDQGAAGDVLTIFFSTEQAESLIVAGDAAAPCGLTIGPRLEYDEEWGINHDRNATWDCASRGDRFRLEVVQ